MEKMLDDRDNIEKAEVVEDLKKQIQIEGESKNLNKRRDPYF